MTFKTFKMNIKVFQSSCVKFNNVSKIILYFPTKLHNIVILFVLNSDIKRKTINFIKLRIYSL